MRRPGYGVVIVTYNSGDWIGPCVESCPVPPTVVDNHSADNSVSQASRAGRVIVNKENRGFAAAVNQGIRATPGDFILLLNPDARIASDLGEMLAAFADPQVGAVAGCLTDTAGKPQTGFAIRRFPTPWTLVFESFGLNRIWPENPVNRRYRCLDCDLGAPQDTDQPAGAFLMVRRAAWEQIGGFDEQFYPVWYEDVDFCLRLRQNGWRIRYVPGVRAIHAGGHSVGRLPWSSKQMYWYGSLLRYVDKHFERAGARSVALAVLGAALPRAFVGILHTRSIQPLKVYGKVALLAWRGIVGRPESVPGSSDGKSLHWK